MNLETRTKLVLISPDSAHRERLRFGTFPEDRPYLEGRSDLATVVGALTAGLSDAQREGVLSRVLKEMFSRPFPLLPSGSEQLSYSLVKTKCRLLGKYYFCHPEFISGS